MLKKAVKLFALLMTTVLMLTFCSFTNFLVFAKGKSAKHSALVEKEPIDVVMTYVDLTDPKLQKTRKSRIKKDEENGEIRYSVRSILQNMPWINKIFILMPNDRVKYFKSPKSISEKIVYINDRDVLGFPSHSSITYEFNLWRLKKFGVSENFIYMNDDWFIGKPLKKSDFFYESNGKVVPYVNSTTIGKNQKAYTQSAYRNLLKHKNNTVKDTGNDYWIQYYATHLFIYKMFGDNVPVLYHTHNAIAENLTDLKELYDFVDKNYKHADACLRSYKRKYESLQPQVLYSCYFYNKHHRKFKKVSCEYIDLCSAGQVKLSAATFCINKSNDREYSEEEYARCKIAMHMLFPKPTRYERRVIKNGAYVIESALKKGMVLDVAEGSSADCANIRLWGRNDTDAQKFNVILQSDGTYVLEPWCSGKRTDVYAGGNEPGTNIWQYSKNGTDAQKWYLVPTNNGYYYLVSKCNGLCMDVDNACTYNGTNIKCWCVNGNIAQKFKLLKV